MPKKKNKTKKIYNCAIIGAGRIGAQFDTPASRDALTHAHAYWQYPRTKLVGLYDVNYTVARHAAAIWFTQAFKSLDELMTKAKPEIVSVCVPDAHHFFVLKQLAIYQPKMVICEKPLTLNVKDAKVITELYQKKRIPLAVNYSRRFDPVVRSVQVDLDAGVYGKVICASAIYTKSLLHNGSHAIDLARYFFGEIIKIHYREIKPKNPASAAMVTARLELKRCSQFHLMVGDAKAYSLFEFDILTEKGRLRFTDAGFQFSKQIVQASPLYKGYSVLSRPITKNTKLKEALLQLVNNSIEHLEEKVKLWCDAKEAYATQVACLSLLKR